MTTKRTVVKRAAWSAGLVTVIGAVALVAWRSGWFPRGASPRPSFSSESRKVTVQTREVHAGPLSDVLLFPARLLPRVNAAVLADADGVVVSIRAPLGSRVKAGAHLLTLRNIDPAYRYAPLVVASPVAGVVGEVDVSEGTRVSRGEKLLVVTDPDRVRVTIEVPSQDIKKLKAGMTGELRLAGSDHPIKLVLKGISPMVDAATGTARSELEIEHAPDGVALAPGAVGRASFETNKRKGIMIRDSALAFVNRAPHARVVVDGRARLAPVKLGRKQSGSVEVLNGLKSGDVVIERASGHLADGDEVDAQPAEAPIDDGRGHGARAARPEPPVANEERPELNASL